MGFDLVWCECDVDDGDEKMHYFCDYYSDLTRNCKDSLVRRDHRYRRRRRRQRHHHLDWRIRSLHFPLGL